MTFEKRHRITEPMINIFETNETGDSANKGISKYLENNSNEGTNHRMYFQYFCNRKRILVKKLSNIA